MKVRISFVGDLMCDPYQLKLIQKSSHTFDEIFSDIGDAFKNADYVVGNLETPIAGPKAGFSKLPGFFNTPIEFAKAIKNAGINFVSTANNHCMDRGVGGIAATIEHLNALGLRHTGTYCKKEDSEKIELVEIKGVKFAFVAATYGFNSENRRKGVVREVLPEEEEWRIDLLKQPKYILAQPDKETPPVSYTRKLKNLIIKMLPKRLYKAICAYRFGDGGSDWKYAKTNFIPDCVSAQDFNAPQNKKRLQRFQDKLLAARRQADFVIALPHIGGQYNPAPGEYQKLVIKSILECGVDLIVANHSHNPQPVFRSEDGTLVANSLGNFCFTPRREWYVENSLGEYGVVMNVCFDVESRSVANEFSIVKNVIEPDGFAKTIEVEKLLSLCTSQSEREYILCELDAVRYRLTGTYRQIFNGAS